MSSKKLRPLADFEWASAAKYICYISSIAGLQEINSNHVNSFPLARVGPEKLLKQKERVLLLLEGNKKKVELFVGEHRAELGDNELSVLRTIYLQNKSCAETVRGHIGFIEVCVEEMELALLQLKEADEDDLF